jgi:hypothetical protein
MAASVTVPNIPLMTLVLAINFAIFGTMDF